MPKRKFPARFYTTVDALCHEGSISEVCQLIQREFPEVPKSSLRCFISKARVFGDCTRDYPKHKTILVKVRRGPTPEEIFGTLKPEQIEESLWSMLSKGRDAINRVKILEELTSVQAREIEKLTIENKRLIENKQKELTSRLEVKEQLIRDLGDHESQRLAS